jgi:hypothetical protein
MAGLQSKQVNFARILGEVAGFLDERGYRFGVVGALALHAHGLTRTTADVDLVVEGRAQGDLLGFLDGLGYERLHVSAGFSNHVHPLDAFGRLDFLYVDGPTADRLFTEARRVTLFPGQDVAVPRPEHLAAMKVLAMKNDPSRTFKELADIQFLLELPDVDQDFIRGEFDRHGLKERFDELLEAIRAGQS